MTLDWRSYSTVVHLPLQSSVTTSRLLRALDASQRWALACLLYGLRTGLDLPQVNAQARQQLYASLWHVEEA